jgi:hypothetical protein
VRTWAAALAAVALTTGCGGDERQAAREWKDKVDAACLRTSKALDRRDWPATVAELERRTDAAADAVHVEAVTIAKLEPPDSLRPAAADVGEAVTRVDRRLQRIRTATAGGDMDEIDSELVKLEPEAEDLDYKGSRIDLAACAEHHLDVFVEQAKFPVFTPRYVALMKRYARDAKVLSKHAAVNTKTKAVSYFAMLQRVLARTERDFGELEPPALVGVEALEYRYALEDFEAAADRQLALVQRLPATSWPLPARRYRGIQRAFERAERTRIALARVVPVR